jgi:hypothetical protein
VVGYVTAVNRLAVRVLDYTFPDPTSSAIPTQSTPANRWNDRVQLWCGLSLDTHRGYTTAIHSYEYFCAMEALTAWPATPEVLYEWVSARVNGHRGQAKVQPNTVEQYLSALRSHHIDLDLPVTPFEDARFRRILAGAKRIHTPY